MRTQRKLEAEFLKVLRRDGAEKLLNRLSLACRDEAERLRPRYFTGAYPKLAAATETQVALLGAKAEVRTAAKRRGNYLSK